MPLSNADYFTARAMPALTHSQNVSDFIQREPERFALTNKPQPLQVGLGIDSVTRILSLRFRQQFQSFIEPNGLHSHTRSFCKLAYLHRMSLNPKPRYRVKDADGNDSRDG